MLPTYNNDILRREYVLLLLRADVSAVGARWTTNDKIWIQKKKKTDQTVRIVDITATTNRSGHVVDNGVRDVDGEQK